MALLSVEDLVVEIRMPEGRFKAVEGISFSVEVGETVAIVGESGSGKSVTALAIMGLLPAPVVRIKSGRVVYDGRDLTRLDAESMRLLRGREIAMVFQEPMTSLNPVRTIGVQLTEAMKLNLNMSSAEAEKRAVELLGEVSIADPERRLIQYPHQFSGGMRQRVMIAMAMACRPRLVIADEPTTALDVTIQSQILSLMQNLSRKFGVAMLLITHNLGIVARFANRVNVMYGGSIVESATTDSLYHDPGHPYTRGLLASVPRLDQPLGGSLIPIDGNPADPFDVIPGCRFSPRCPLVTEACRRRSPDLSAYGDADHQVACWNVTPSADTESGSVAAVLK